MGPLRPRDVQRLEVDPFGTFVIALRQEDLGLKPAMFGVVGMLARRVRDDPRVGQCRLGFVQTARTQEPSRAGSESTGAAAPSA